MKRITLLASLVFALASLSACTPIDRDAAYRSPTGSVSGMPQPANSLPEGASVNSPLTSRTGAIETTPIAPSRTPAGQRGNSY